MVYTSKENMKEAINKSILSPLLYRNLSIILKMSQTNNMQFSYSSTCISTCTFLTITRCFSLHTIISAYLKRH